MKLELYLGGVQKKIPHCRRDKTQCYISPCVCAWIIFCLCQFSSRSSWWMSALGVAQDVLGVCHKSKDLGWINMHVGPFSIIPRPSRLRKSSHTQGSAARTQVYTDREKVRLLGVAAQTKGARDIYRLLGCVKNRSEDIPRTSRDAWEMVASERMDV